MERPGFKDMIQALEKGHAAAVFVKDAYVKKKPKKVNPKTLKAYRIDLNQFALHVSNESEALSKNSFLRYIHKLRKDYQPKSAKRKIACLRAFMSYLEFEEIIERNALSKIWFGFKEPHVLPKTLSLGTIQKLLCVAPQ